MVLSRHLRKQPLSCPTRQWDIPVQQEHVPGPVRGQRGMTAALVGGIKGEDSRKPSNQPFWKVWGSGSCPIRATQPLLCQTLPGTHFLELGSRNQGQSELFFTQDTVPSHPPPAQHKKNGCKKIKWLIQESVISLMCQGLACITPPDANESRANID